MGGYAGFIWPVYIVFAVLMLGIFFHSRHFAKTSEARLNALKPTPDPSTANKETDHET